MTKNHINAKRGFTIIEVVLVLAIAGLIFLMVFVALPSMQRAQRDTQRRNDYSTLSANLTMYITNNNGSLPATVAATMVNSQGTDPEGNTYSITVNTTGCQSSSSCSITAPSTGQIVVVTNATCSGGKPAYKKGARNFVVYGYMENDPGYTCIGS